MLILHPGPAGRNGKTADRFCFRDRKALLLRVEKPAAKSSIYEKLDVRTLTAAQQVSLDKLRQETDRKIARALAEEQAEIQNLLDADERKAVGDLDSMSDIGEMDSIRLQKTMDRRAKAMEMLSNILKKAGDTSSAIIQNLK